MEGYITKDYITWVLLSQTRNALLKARDKELRQYGITAVQAAVLCWIQAIGNSATPAEISRCMLREPHTISRLVDRMVRKGLLSKTKDLERRNLVRVSLTEKGRQAYYHSTKVKSVHKVVSCLSEEEREQMNLCLKKLRTAQLKELGVKCKLAYLKHLMKSNI